MYALNVGVRNEFFSLSCFSETPEMAIEKSQDVIKSWCGPYNLDPSWDQGMNGQDNSSLVWCRDGAKTLTQEHFKDGFFMILVQESKDSEIKLWEPVRGSMRIVCMHLSAKSGGNGLHIVKPFRPSNSVERNLRKNPFLVPFSATHLNGWVLEAVNKDLGFSSETFAWPDSYLLPRRLNVVSAN